MDLKHQSVNNRLIYLELNVSLMNSLSVVDNCHINVLTFERAPMWCYVEEVLKFLGIISDSEKLNK